jgi:hypothetical protein
MRDWLLLLALIMITLSFDIGALQIAAAITAIL